MGGSVQKLTHWGLTAYFYPQAAVKMAPDGPTPEGQQPRLIEAPPGPATSQGFFPALGKSALWVILAILLAIYALYLHSVLGEIRREYTVLKEANLATPDPVTTTVFSTFTATTTSFSTATTTFTLGNKWFFAGDSSAASEPPEPTHLPWESIDNSLPAYSNAPSVKPRPEPTQPKDDIFEKSKDLSSWSTIQLPSSREMTEHLRWAIVGLWKVVRKVWNYPLDIP